MLRFKILITFLIFALFVSAQSKLSNEFTIETSTPYKVIDAATKLYYTVNEESVIAIKASADLITLQLFDVKNMVEVKRNEYSDFPKYSKFQEIIEIKGKMYYFFEAFNKKNDNFSVYCREIDRENARFGKIRKLFTTKGVVKGTIVDPLEKNTIQFVGVRLGPKFKIQKSLDESKIIISYRNKRKVISNKKIKDVIGIYVYDSEFKKLWNHEVNMPYTESVINTLAYGVSRNGTAFIITYDMKGESYSVLTLNNLGNLNETKLDIDGAKKVNNLKMVESESGNIIFSGFYTNINDFQLIMDGKTDQTNCHYGILSFEFDEFGSVLFLNDLLFSNAFINEYQSSNKQKRSKMRVLEKQVGFSDLRLIDFYIGEDGSYYYVGEQQFVRLESGGIDSEGRSDTDIVLYYRNLVIVKTNTDGSIEWMRKLPKFQSGKFGRGLLGTYYANSKNKHYFLFLDNPDNIDVPINEAPEMYSRGKDGVLTAFVVNDESGDFKRYQILTLDNINGIKSYKFITSRLFSTTEDVLFFEVYIKKKKDIFVRLRLED